jgi:hypothetical protein
MSKHDLKARPIYHRQRDSIEAHLTGTFPATAFSALEPARQRMNDPRTQDREPSQTRMSSGTGIRGGQFRRYVRGMTGSADRQIPSESNAERLP